MVGFFHWSRGDPVYEAALWGSEDCCGLDTHICHTTVWSCSLLSIWRDWCSTRSPVSDCRWKYPPVPLTCVHLLSFRFPHASCRGKLWRINGCYVPNSIPGKKVVADNSYSLIGSCNALLKKLIKIDLALQNGFDHFQVLWFGQNFEWFDKSSVRLGRLGYVCLWVPIYTSWLILSCLLTQAGVLSSWAFEFSNNAEFSCCFRIKIVSWCITSITGPVCDPYHWSY